MGTKIEQLEKQVEVLREVLGLLKVYSGDRTTRNAASVAIIAADRIAAEPVEETDWETLAEFVDGDYVTVGYRVGEEPWFDSISQFAAWIRAQKEKTP